MSSMCGFSPPVFMHHQNARQLAAAAAAGVGVGARKAVAVNDSDHQYAVMHFIKDSAPAAAYVLYRTGKESCKDAGWNLGLNSTQSFKNQGQCVAFFADGDKESHSDESGDISNSANEND